MHFNSLILQIFAKIAWQHLDISSQNSIVIFISFRTKMFSCIIAKRAGFEYLVMSYAQFATRFKRRQHTENITDDDEFPGVSYPFL